MDIVNTTDRPQRYRRTHRFGDEQSTIVLLEPGRALPASQVHDFQLLEDETAADVWSDPALLAALAKARAHIESVTAIRTIEPLPKFAQPKE